MHPTPLVPRRHPSPRRPHAASAVLLFASLALTACAAGAPGAPPGTTSMPGSTSTPRGMAPPPIAADSGVSSELARGIRLHSVFRSAGPFAIHLLDIDRTACWMPAVLKRDSTAVGRLTTSALLGRASARGDTIAAVNADFFLFAPPGVPTGAHVDDGRVIAGPGVRPVLAVDSSGAAAVKRLGVTGRAVGRRDTVHITSWNHLPVTGVGAFDERWGVWTDSTTGTVQVMVGRDGRVVRTVSGAVRASIPRGGWVLATSGRSPAAARRWLAALRPGDSVDVRVALDAPHLMDVVGGHPLLVRDGRFAPILDSASVRTLATVRHPRTAVGLSRDGRRMFLVVVDGRRPGYSVGMTLPELAALMIEMGAHTALNLDGGGSSTMAIRPRGDDVRVVNRPSDAEGERAVANALAIVRGCPR